jgi:hypothetical protein
LGLSFRDAVNTSMYALAKTSLFSTALKDNHNTTVSHGVIEKIKIGGGHNYYIRSGTIAAIRSSVYK